MSNLDERIEAVRKEYGLSADDFWQIKQNKQWVCKHAALEVVAVKAKIDWLPPQIIEANAPNLVTSMVVTGRMGDRTEWATGETNQTNYSVTGKQPAYPWAMSEKRAKDRVILKLVGIHGLVYSDSEGDFPTTAPAHDDEPEEMSNTAAKEHWKTIADAMFACTTLKQLQGAWTRHYRVYQQLPAGLQKELEIWKDELKDKLMEQAEQREAMAATQRPVTPNFDNLETAQ